MGEEIEERSKIAKFIVRAELNLHEVGMKKRWPAVLCPSLSFSVAGQYECLHHHVVDTGGL